MNEARGYEGLGARYTPEEVDAFRNGVGSGGASRMYPYLYPNVNWIDETFKDRGVSNKYTIEFRGGGAKFRYYTMANLLTDKGFIKTPNACLLYTSIRKVRIHTVSWLIRRRNSQLRVLILE